MDLPLCIVLKTISLKSKCNTPTLKAKILKCDCFETAKFIKV